MGALFFCVSGLGRQSRPVLVFDRALVRPQASWAGWRL